MYTLQKSKFKKEVIELPLFPTSSFFPSQVYILLPTISNFLIFLARYISDCSLFEFTFRVTYTHDCLPFQTYSFFLQDLPYCLSFQTFALFWEGIHKIVSLFELTFSYSVYIRMPRFSFFYFTFLTRLIFCCLPFETYYNCQVHIIVPVFQASFSFKVYIQLSTF